jgi:HEPN domain-containing protein
MPDVHEKVTNLNLLVVCNSDVANSQVHDIIENACKDIIPVTALIMSIDWFYLNLCKNSTFSGYINESATLLYETELSFLSKPCTNEIQGSSDQAQSAHQRAVGFLAAAELHLLRKEPKLAAFMLHQVFEQYCLSKALLAIGVNPKTHNLDRLYRIFKLFSFDLLRAFPRDNQEEIRLFETIKDAYIKARYHTEYHPKTRLLQIVAERLRTLLTY